MHHLRCLAWNARSEGYVVSCRHARLIHKKKKGKKKQPFFSFVAHKPGSCTALGRCAVRRVAAKGKCHCWLYRFSWFPFFHILTFSLWLRSFFSQPVVLHFLPVSGSPSASGPPTRTPHCRLPTSGPVSPALKKGCCHREIACKCPGELHRVLSYRDVKCLKPLTQMVEPDSRTTQLQWCCETLKGSCY